METRAHYVAVGAFVLTMITLAFVAVLWLARAQLTTQYAHYDIFFRGPVSGLRDGSAVEYSGVPVGKVIDVRIAPDNVEQIRVTVEIDSSTLIKEDARASVETNILSGVSFIQIVGGTQDAPTLVAHEGERYPVIQAHRSRLASVTARAPELIEKISDAVDRVNGVLSDKNREALSASLDNIQSFTKGLADRNQDIADLTTNAKQAAASLSQLIDTVEKSYAGPDGLGNRAAEAIADFDRVAKNLIDTNRQLQLTLQDVRPGVRTFSQQTLGDVGVLVGEARQLVTNLNRLTAQISRNPSQVLFGDRREGYRP
jgi:phospholipid/cholesterol/gamma-HCH transport system substrate-binding protein